MVEFYGKILKCPPGRARGSEPDRRVRPRRIHTDYINALPGMGLLVKPDENGRAPIITFGYDFVKLRGGMPYPKHVMRQDKPKTPTKSRGLTARSRRATLADRR